MAAAKGAGALAPTGPRVSRTYRGWGAVTAITRLKPGARAQLWAVFAFGRLTTIAVRPLTAMRVIALARWTLWPSAWAPRYLIFETNWSGSDQTYIPDLGRAMPVQWKSIWGVTEKFPGSIPTTGLLTWVEQIDAGSGHLWTDYADGATTETILRGLDLQTRMRRFLADPDRTDAELARDFEGLLGDIEGLL